MPAYEHCSNCNGGGEVCGMEGMIFCPECHGKGTIVARDGTGRFVSYKTLVWGK